MVQYVKIVTFCPSTHADQVRKAIGDAGAGIIGNYSHCSYQVIGKGKYIPLDGAKPFIGEVGKFEEVVEERIEVTCPREKAREVVAAMKKMHPYEEVVFDVYPLLNEEEL